MALDLADCTGFAIMDGPSLVAMGILYKDDAVKRRAAPWTVEEYLPPEIGEEPKQSIKRFDTQYAAWDHIEHTYAPQKIVAEDVRGGFPQANIALGVHRGWVQRHFKMPTGSMKCVAQQTWRSETKHLIEASSKWEAGKWPGGALNKEVAIDITYRRVGIEVPSDAADAYMIALAVGGAIGDKVSLKAKKAKKKRSKQ